MLLIADEDEPGGAQAVFIGPSNVTPATGFRVKPGGALTLDLDPDEGVWGIVAAGDQVVFVLEN